MSRRGSVVVAVVLPPPDDDARSQRRRRRSRSKKNHRNRHRKKLCRACHFVALQASVSASASAIVACNAQLTLVSIRRSMISLWKNTTTSTRNANVLPAGAIAETIKPQVAAVTTSNTISNAPSSNISTRRRLSRVGQALLPTCCSPTSAANDLEAILRRTTILKPNTVGCMIRGLQAARRALLELTPCHVSLREFQARSGGDAVRSAAELVYKVVREAVEQCDDTVEYYCCRRSKSLDPNQHFSGRTLPPFASYNDDNDDLQNLSDQYWSAEIAIQNIHRHAAPECKIDPGFSGECISILCHAFEVGEAASPIGVNLFEVRRDGGNAETVAPA